jgi:hypothetical protein
MAAASSGPSAVFPIPSTVTEAYPGHVEPAGSERAAPATVLGYRRVYQERQASPKCWASTERQASPEHWASQAPWVSP